MELCFISISQHPPALSRVSRCRSLCFRSCRFSPQRDAAFPGVAGCSSQSAFATAFPLCSASTLYRGLFLVATAETRFTAIEVEIKQQKKKERSSCGGNKELSQGSAVRSRRTAENRSTAAPVSGFRKKFLTVFGVDRFSGRLGNQQ